MVGIIVGVNLIAPVNTVIKTITTPTYNTATVSIAGVLTIIFVTVIILTGVGWMGFRS
jgi:hypothetical protein